MRQVKAIRGLALGVLIVAATPAFGLAGAPESMRPDGPDPELSPEFVWAPLAGAAYYRLNIRDVANTVVFNHWITSAEAGCEDGQGTCRFHAGDIFTPGSYRWKVIAKSEAGALSNWSDWRVFYPGQSDIPGPPQPPQTESPSGLIATNFPEFSWLPAEETSRYRFQVRDADNKVVLNRGRRAAAVGCSDGLSLCAFRSPKALGSGEYRWKVRGKNRLSGQKSAWSPWMHFTVPPAQALGSGLDERPANESCTLPEAPARVSGLAAERVFPNLPLSEVVILVQLPAAVSPGKTWLAVGKSGRVMAFDAGNTQASSLDVYLDISDRVLADTGETGLLGLAFHPEFPVDYRAYLFYTNVVNGEYESYLSEFLSPDGGQSLDASTERRLLTITGHGSHNHKGGTVAFGPDGFLYLGLGDGGTPMESQNPYSLFGSLLRIDVDQGDPYAIPADNPFADGVDGAPEVYAYGFRNPWRWSFDPDNGMVWLTDVGHTRWEEINLVEPGANYGWPIFEAYECRISSQCGTPNLRYPLHAYPHDPTGGYVVVGGYVYRGSALPGLRGTFVYADGSDRVWALYFSQNGQPEPELVIDGGLSGDIVRSMFEDEDGELYLVKSRFIYRLVADESEPEYAFPTRLSETGCVDPARPTETAAGVIPYAINTAFWTDGAAKSRWMAVPDGDAIEVDADGDFHFPPGSVLVKEFRLFDKRIETRLLARHADGNWAGYSYAWNEDESEAELVGPAGRQLEISGQGYTIPGRSQCLRCHTFAAGRSLGLEIRQLNRDFHYPSTNRSANQLTTLEAVGLLEHTLPDRPENLPALVPLDDHSVSFADRARSYLHSNCSGCHRPDGGGGGPADMRFQPLESMNICDVAPEIDDFGIEGARLLAPGHPERSIVAVRMGSVGPNAMPPIGKNLVDIDAVAVLEEFISGLESCPGSQ